MSGLTSSYKFSCKFNVLRKTPFATHPFSIQLKAQFFYAHVKIMAHLTKSFKEYFGVFLGYVDNFALEAGTLPGPCAWRGGGLAGMRSDQRKGNALYVLR